MALRITLEVNSVFYVISYDIPDDRRRNQLAKVLKGFGTRVQYSVFEAHLNRTQYRGTQARYCSCYRPF